MLQCYVLGVQFCGSLRQLVLLQRQQFLCRANPCRDDMRNSSNLTSV